MLLDAGVFLRQSEEALTHVVQVAADAVMAYELVAQGDLLERELVVRSCCAQGARRRQKDG